MPESVPVPELLSGVTTIALAVFWFMFRTHWKKTDEHDKRLRDLESDRVTKEDITEVHRKIEAVGQQVTTGHNEVMRTLLNWKREQ